MDTYRECPHCKAYIQIHEGMLDFIQCNNCRNTSHINDLKEPKIEKLGEESFDELWEDGEFPLDPE